MSKYKQRGDYHFQEFEDPNSIYRAHVLDLVRQICLAVPPGGKILDVGCGEGLILRQLELEGYRMEGCDIDPIAVELAQKRGFDVRLRTISTYANDDLFDAVILCDVLEHVDSFELTISKAKLLAPVVVIAVPDRPDPHAVRQQVDKLVFAEFIDWNMIHFTQRHARHLMIFVKNEVQ